jgi:hypothetical protein
VDRTAGSCPAALSAYPSTIANEADSPIFRATRRIGTVPVGCGFRLAEVVAQFPGNNAARAHENMLGMKPAKIVRVFGEGQLPVTKQLGERAPGGSRGRESDFGARVQES